jgi:hypothetical protein
LKTLMFLSRGGSLCRRPDNRSLLAAQESQEISP